MRSGNKIGAAGLAIILATAAAPGAAEPVACRLDDRLRTVEVVRASPNEPVPCEVVYDKSSEGQGRSVLWRAQRERGYCEARMEEFVAKLEGMGWSCDAPDAEPAGT